MTMLRIWHALTYVGDSTVLLPCAVLLFAWLMATPATRRTGWSWLVAVLTAGGGVALSKVLYMVFGWHPAGWNFTGLSGHAAFSLLFWPSAAALVTGRKRTTLRAALVALGVCLALAISASSWVLRDHSLVEVALGAMWGASVAAVFLTVTWRRAAEAPVVRKWMIASVLLVVIIAFGHGFPSTRVMGWIALHASGHTAIHSRCDLGPHARLSNQDTDCPHPDSSAARPHTPR